MMSIQIKNNAFSCLFLAMIFSLCIPMFSSCGKSGTVNATLNTQVNVINLSPDLLPVDFYVNYVKRNTQPYFYAIPSGYVSITTLVPPLQIRTHQNSSTTVAGRDTVLSANTKYTWIITGLYTNGTLVSIFTADTAAAPKIGYGKVRFIHASPNTVNLDVYANGTMAFQNQPYKVVSKYLQLPAGNYDFKIYATGTTNLYSDLPATTIQDGRLFTIYTRGIAGRTDTAAISAAVTINR